MSWPWAVNVDLTMRAPCTMEKAIFNGQDVRSKYQLLSKYRKIEAGVKLSGRPHHLAGPCHLVNWGRTGGGGGNWGGGEMDQVWIHVWPLSKLAVDRRPAVLPLTTQGK